MPSSLKGVLTRISDRKTDHTVTSNSVHAAVSGTFILLNCLEKSFPATQAYERSLVVMNQNSLANENLPIHTACGAEKPDLKYRPLVLFTCQSSILYLGDRCLHRVDCPCAPFNKVMLVLSSGKSAGNSTRSMY